MKKFLLLGILCLSSLLSYGQHRILSATQYHIGQPSSITASGDRINPQKLSAGRIRWVALSHDLIKEYPFNTLLEVKCEIYPELNGIWVVKDKMSQRLRNSIDFLMPRGKSRLGRTSVRVRKYVEKTVDNS